MKKKIEEEERKEKEEQRLKEIEEQKRKNFENEEQKRKEIEEQRRKKKKEIEEQTRKEIEIEEQRRKEKHEQKLRQLEEEEESLKEEGKLLREDIHSDFKATIDCSKKNSQMQVNMIKGLAAATVNLYKDAGYFNGHPDNNRNQGAHIREIEAGSTEERMDTTPPCTIQERPSKEIHPSKVAQFLTEAELTELIPIFVREKIDFDQLMEITSEELKELKVPLGDRKRLLKIIQDNTPVSQFLIEAGLKVYYPKFVDKNIDMKKLMLMTNTDLEDLGLSPEERQNFMAIKESKKNMNH